MELVNHFDCSWCFELVEKYDHSATLLQKLKAESKLSHRQSTSLPGLSVGCSGLSAENLAVTEDNVKFSALLKFFGKEVAGVRVLFGDVVRTHVSSKHSDVKHLGLDIEVSVQSKLMPTSFDGQAVSSRRSSTVLRHRDREERSGAMQRSRICGPLTCALDVLKAPVEAWSSLAIFCIIWKKNFAFLEAWCELAASAALRCRSKNLSPSGLFHPCNLRSVTWSVATEYESLPPGAID